MSQVITATFVDGVLKPEEELALASGTKVRLMLDTCNDVRAEGQEACTELDRLCDEFPIDSRGRRLTRDQVATAADLPSADAMRMWMSSTDGHRENILKPRYKEIGIGVGTTTDGKRHWTQLFAVPVGE
jgi:predicted DNA-binding antitoxin AbrB/MazE fold protein